MQPVRITITGSRTQRDGNTGTALAYFRDSEGESWAALEMDDQSLIIMHQNYVREDQSDVH